MISYDRGIRLVAAAYFVLGLLLGSVAFFTDGLGVWSVVTGGGAGALIATGYLVWRGEMVPSEVDE